MAHISMKQTSVVTAVHRSDASSNQIPLMLKPTTQYNFPRSLDPWPTIVIPASSWETAHTMILSSRNASATQDQ